MEEGLQLKLTTESDDVHIHSAPRKTNLLRFPPIVLFTNYVRLDRCVIQTIGHAATNL